MGSSFKCNLCNRSMPPGVYEAHLKKSHTPEEVQGKIQANEKEIKKLGVENVFVATEQVGKLANAVSDLANRKEEFDWGEVYPCAACGEKFPAKAMDFHSWVKHRV